MNLRSLGIAAASMLAISVAGCSHGDQPNAPQAATNPHTDGATGKTIVPGSDSTMSEDKLSTHMMKTGSP